MTSARRILIADDDEPVQRVLARMLDGPAYEIVAAGDGESALTLAAQSNPDLILLDVNMPKKNGWEVLDELRRSPLTRMIPVILLTSAAAASDKVGGLRLGADDYVTKPFSQPELIARVDGLLRRHRQSLSANPLTGLPGNPAIEEEVSRRIAAGTPFAFFYIDIDRFKAFNDAYGFAEGDRVLLETAGLIRASLEDGFVGHIGGDDFVAISGLEEAPHVAQRLATLFDERAPGFGRPKRGPCPTLSIAVATTARRRFANYAEVAAVSSELKAHLKSESGRTLSRFAFDRRTAPKVKSDLSAS